MGQVHTKFVVPKVAFDPRLEVNLPNITTSELREQVYGNPSSNSTSGSSGPAFLYVSIHT